MKKLTKVTGMCALALALPLLAGCATFEGMKADINSAGQKVSGQN